MNELMIILAGDQWLYFKTDEVAADRAIDRFLEAAEGAGINTDNLNILGANPRNSGGETISGFGIP